MKTPNHPTPEGAELGDLMWTGHFGVFDPDVTDDHGPIYLVCPGGQMINFSGDATPGLDAKRVNWIAATLNAARSALPTPADQERVEQP